MTELNAGSGASSHSPDEPSPDSVRQELVRVLESAAFNKSARLQRFLRYVVDETLAGRGDALKEYAIAIEVFDRDSSFDPQTNSLVRVEASRLRRKLETYNAVDGRDDPIHIELPVGSYMPSFEAVEEAVPSARAPSTENIQARHLLARPAIAIAAGLVVLVTIGLAIALFVPIVERHAGVSASGGMSSTVQTPTIAVLPLRNLSGRPDEEYFSDGMTGALITTLAKRASVRVISLTSAMSYKDVNRPIADIARELNVSHVVEGAVVRSGGRVRITAQLVEAATDRQLWAESYERQMSDVLAIQDDVAQRIVASLSDNLDVTTVKPARVSVTVDADAQEAYLRGRYFRNQMTEQGFRKGIAYFKQAITKAPDYAPAYAGMAACYCLLGGHGFELVEPREGMPSAKAAALAALELDRNLPEPHAFLGIIRLKYEWDWVGAEASFRRAIALNPSYAQAHVFYSFFLEAMGRQDEAIREAEVAQTLDPLSLPANVNLGWQYLRAERLEQALRQFEKTGELRSDFWGIQWGRGHYYRRTGDYDQAIAAFRKAVEIGGGYTLPLTDLGYTYAAAGRTAEAREVIGRLKEMAEDSYVSPYNMAVIHIGLGETDEAFAWLDKAFDARSRSLAWLRVAAEFDEVRGDPRFASLMRRVGLAE